MRDIIFVSLENWDEVWRRNQFLCAGLARRFPDCKILFVGLPRDVSHGLRQGRFAQRRTPETWSVPGLPNITVTHPIKLFPNTLAAGRRLNEAMARAHIQRAARRLGISNALLWLNPHSAVHMAGRMGERAVIYDITDDWTLAAFPAREKQRIEAQDRRLCALADLVVVCSKALEKSRRAGSRRILLLPNGVNTEHYQRTPCAPEQSGAPDWPAPVFGYTGTLHPERIDARLIVAAARAFPQGSIALIGPDHLDTATRGRLTAEDNIHLRGAVPYADLPVYMNHFDVCMVPHQESEFTESLNPIKLWEYLACGKPIVSSNVAGFRDYAHLCRIASGPEAFVSACQEALRENGSGLAARRAEAAKHTWDARLDCLLAHLDTLGVSA